MSCMCGDTKCPSCGPAQGSPSTRPIPADDAPLADIVAFMVWNDRHGNWPERISHTDVRIASTVLEREGIISPPINDDHVWYDWEGDYWLTDEECREQLLPILTEWRNEQ